MVGQRAKTVAYLPGPDLVLADGDVAAGALLGVEPEEPVVRGDHQLGPLAVGAGAVDGAVLLEPEVLAARH